MTNQNKKSPLIKETQITKEEFLNERANEVDRTKKEMGFEDKTVQELREMLKKKTVQEFREMVKKILASTNKEEKKGS